MSATPVRCEHDGIKWFPRVTVEKYSPDQSAWAERKLHDELSWGRRLLVDKFGIERIPGLPVLVPRLHGDWMRDAFPSGPEDGFAHAEGNLLVAGGLYSMCGYLLLGVAASGANGNPMKATTGSTYLTGIGVGTAATALVADTKLTNDTGSGSTTSFYQGMDPTYPLNPGSGTANGGQMTGTMTVTSGNANYAWNEWCWFTVSTGMASPYYTSYIVDTGHLTNPLMINHWAYTTAGGASLGTKGSGATWVFSTTITLSLGRKYRLTCVFVMLKESELLGFLNLCPCHQEYGKQSQVPAASRPRLAGRAVLPAGQVHAEDC